MDVKVCMNCRRLFNYVYGPELCPDCKKLLGGAGTDQEKKEKVSGLKPLLMEQEKKLEQVKDYIMTHPKATIAQIAEANEVSANRLFEWVREDRLEFSDDSEDAWFTCIKCGTKIKSGLYCYQCKPRH